MVTHQRPRMFAVPQNVYTHEIFEELDLTILDIYIYMSGLIKWDYLFLFVLVWQVMPWKSRHAVDKWGCIFQPSVQTQAISRITNIQESNMNVWRVCWQTFRNKWLIMRRLFFYEENNLQEQKVNTHNETFFSFMQAKFDVARRLSAPTVFFSLTILSIWKQPEGWSYA